MQEQLTTDDLVMLVGRMTIEAFAKDRTIRALQQRLEDQGRELVALRAAEPDAE